MKQRLEAKKQVQAFFKAKRKALDVESFWDFSRGNAVKRQLLTEMNAIARDAEHQAMQLAERGDNWEPALSKAKQKLEKLKKRVLDSLPPGGQFRGESYKEVADLIRSL